MGMTATATPSRTFSASATGASRGWLGELATAERLLVGGALGLAFIGLFFRWFVVQAKWSLSQPEDWSHAFAIPLIAGYLIWRRRETLRSVSVERFWPGLLVMGLGIVCYLFFVVGVSNHMLQGFAMILTLAGLALLTLGPRVFPAISMPLAYLGFGVTISELIMLKVTAQLQLIASWASWVALNVMGFTTARAGNVLQIAMETGEEIPLNVAEACSGMRMVVAFFALGAAVALISCRHWWQRAALLLLVGPVAIFVNALRVVSLGVLSVWDGELARGDAHIAIGTLWLVPAFVLFMGVVWVLKRLAEEPAGSMEGGA